MKIALVTNASPTSGVGKPARILAHALRRDSTLVVDEYFLDAASSGIRKNSTMVRDVRTFTSVKPVQWFFLGRALQCDDYDVVHFTNQTLGALARRLSRPCVLTVWDLIELENPQQVGGSLVARLLFGRISSIDHVIVPSMTTAGALKRRYAVPDERLTVIPPAVAREFQYRPAIWSTPEGRQFLQRTGISLVVPRVLYVGSEHQRKNLGRLLEAIALVRRQIPDIEFVKIGPPGVARGRRETLSKVHELGLTGTVRIIEHADSAELLYWYHAARAFAFPTLLEGFGIPPLEAMSCGTPVVTSNRSSLPEVVDDAALLVDPGDSGAIAHALLRVILDEHLRTELRVKGLARARTFSHERMANATLNVYRHVVGSRH